MNHKWAKEAIAFFSGEIIQLRDTNNPSAEFKDWDLPGVPPFDQKFYEFRIKPKEVVMYKWAVLEGSKWIEYGYFLADEKSFRKAYETENPIKRLDYTATTFPVGSS